MNIKCLQGTSCKINVFFFNFLKLLYSNLVKKMFNAEASKLKGTGLLILCQFRDFLGLVHVIASPLPDSLMVIERTRRKITE